MGIDQGLANCGYAVIEMKNEKMKILTSGILVTKPTVTISNRVRYLYEAIRPLAMTYHIERMGCERLFYSYQQRATNKSASMMHTNMITGILHLIAAEQQVPLYEFVPGTVKKEITGSGKASKEDVFQSIMNWLPEVSKMSSHESDAIAIGITALLYNGNKKEEFA
jgi:crossover junction endodeoxyribonuclease RuvC